MQEVHIPDGRFIRQALDANSPLPGGPLAAHPHDAKLSLIVLVLHIQDGAYPHRSNHAVQHGPLITDVSDLGMLSEGHRLGVDSPDAHRQECSDTSVATTIHKFSWGGVLAMLGQADSDSNLLQLPGAGNCGHLAVILRRHS